MGWTGRPGRAPESVGMCWQGLSHKGTAANLLLLRCLLLLRLLLLPLLHACGRKPCKPIDQIADS